MKFGSYKDIKNKYKREQAYVEDLNAKKKLKAEKRKDIKAAERKNPELKRKRQEENVPQTVESQRRPIESMLTESDLPELSLEDDGSFPHPQILVTTNRLPRHLSTTKKGSQLAYFVDDLLDSLGGTAIYLGRPDDETLQIKDIAKMACAKGRSYTHLIVVNADRKVVNGLTVVRLPEGPSMYFTVSSYQSREDIKGSGVPTSHIPELVLNNFSSTQLGWKVGRMFQSLWPAQPELLGRQVVTLHNQRDYVFFRRHRYEFKDEKKVNLQELGPRFTLKIKRAEKGIWDYGLLAKVDGEVGDVEWEWNSRLEKDKKTFHL